MPFTLFAADSGNGDVELWSTDGETGRTQRVMDINPGLAGSGVVNQSLTGEKMPFAVLNGFAYFMADDGVHSPGLWRSDGSAAGTKEVSDPAGTPVNPLNIVVANNQLFYIGNGASGIGIYKTAGGVGDPATFITPYTGNISSMFSAGNRLFWVQSNSNASGGLYATDGSGTIQHLVTDTTGSSLAFAAGNLVYSVNNSGSLNRISGSTVTPITGANGGIVDAWAVGSNGTLYFTARYNAVNLQHDLYAVAPGATSVTLLENGIDDGYVMEGGKPSLVTVGDSLLFNSYDSTNEHALWISDGTVAGTHVLKDIDPASYTARLFDLTKVNGSGTVFFQVLNAQAGIDLWKTDGTAAGTQFVKQIEIAGPVVETDKAYHNVDMIPLNAAPSLTNLTSAGGYLFFDASDGVHGTELWRSDGTAAGTFQVLDINTQTVPVDVNGTRDFDAVSYQGRSYFMGGDPDHGIELWSSDGTVAGTNLFKDISIGARGSDPADFIVSGGRLFFTADDGIHGRELWVSDGTPENTHMVVDLNAGARGSSPSEAFAIFSDSIVFFANDGVHGTEAWVSDGSAEGTQLLADIDPGPGSGAGGAFARVGHSAVFFGGNATTGGEPWITDGTPAGTHLLKDIAPGSTGSKSSLVDGTPGSSAQLGTRLYFSADDGTHGSEVWVTNGTAAGTTLFKDLNPNGDSAPSDFTVAGNTLYFVANDGAGQGRQLFATDGTANGTVKLTSQAWQVTDGPGDLTAVGNNLVFVGQTVASGAELYTVTGGTVTLVELSAGSSGSTPDFLATIGTKLYFNATDAVHGNELWVTDGTAAGTKLVADISPGTASSEPLNAVVLGQNLYFSANDGVHGRELWTSDGTAAGTHLLADINPSGNGITDPTTLHVAGNMLAFQGTDGVHAVQDWISDGTAAGTHMVTADTQAMGSDASGFVVPAVISLVGITPETLIGTHDADHLDGNGGNDTLLGKAGDDVLNGGAGNDTIDGGQGMDTAVYSGDYGGANYSITLDPSGTLTVTDLRSGSPDGTDTLTGVETLQFANASITYDLTNAANWTSITTLYDSAGSIAATYVTLDGGGGWVTSYDTTNSSSVLWSTAHFDANQKTIVSVGTNDDGTHLVRVTDHDNLYAWSSFTVNFDANWNQTGFSGINDDSSTNLTMGQVAGVFDTLLWFTTPYDPYNGQSAFSLTLTGGGNTDVLYGRAAADIIDGGAGADQIWGGKGDDTLTGGAGQDVFHFSPGDGSDTIIDFDTSFGSHDTIDLHGFGFATISDFTALISDVGNDALITFDAHNQILIKNAAASLNLNDFVFT